MLLWKGPRSQRPPGLVGQRAARAGRLLTAPGVNRFTRMHRRNTASHKRAVLNLVTQKSFGTSWFQHLVLSETSPVLQAGVGVEGESLTPPHTAGVSVGRAW